MKRKVKRIKQQSSLPLSILKRNAIKAFNAFIRNRDAVRLGGRCYTCGKVGDQAGHYIHSHNSVRFNEILCNLQCFNCNHYASGNLGVYGERLIKEHGIEKIQELRRLSQQTKRFSEAELQAVINKYSIKPA